MKKRLVVILTAAAAGGALGAVLDRAVLAPQSGIKRTVLQRADDPSSSAYEAVMGIAELAPGATSGRHFHHGTELGYVLEGSAVIERPDGTVTVKAGDAVKNEKGALHNVVNRGSGPVKFLSVYIVEKGRPLAEPTP